MSIAHLAGVFSENKDWFYYSAKNKGWSRVLVRGGPQQGFIKEVSICITPEGDDTNWNALADRTSIKIQNPIKDVGDIYTHVLPTEIHNQLVQNLEPMKIFLLLDFDIMGCIPISSITETFVLQDIFSNSTHDPNWMRKYKKNGVLFKTPDSRGNKATEAALQELEEKFSKVRKKAEFKKKK